MSVEQLLRDAVAQGAKGFTLWPCDDGWQASVTFDKTGWRVRIDADPVNALFAALTAEASKPGIEDLLA